jgi:ankyrin repeat protein
VAGDTSDARAGEGVTTALHAAAAWRCVDTTRVLLRRHTELEGEDGDGWRALHHAVHAGCAPVVEMLLQAGARMGKSSTGASVLHVAVEAERRELLDLLLKCVCISRLLTTRTLNSPHTHLALLRELRHHHACQDDISIWWRRKQQGMCVPKLRLALGSQPRV